MTKSRHRLEARWPAEQACRNARRLCRLLELKNASLWPLGPGNLICAHGTILTNRESSELVGECIFYALQVRTQTIYTRKIVVALKNIFRCIYMYIITSQKCTPLLQNTNYRMYSQGPTILDELQ